MSSISVGRKLEILSREDLYAIHQATIQVLEEIGIKSYSMEALKIFYEAGANVDFKEKHIYIPEALLDMVKKAPSCFTVFARNPKHNLEVGNDNVYYTPSSTLFFVFDLETGERRKATLRDCELLLKLNDALPLIHGNACMVHPTDVPEHAAHVYMMLASILNTSKTFRGRCRGKQVALDCIRMASILAGGMEELRKKPNLITISNTVSPLILEENQTEGLIEYARFGLPVGVSSEISAGGTGPITLAGSLVVQNAEVLSGIILTQLINPGTPVLYGTVANIMDVRTGQMSLGSIEAGLLNVATAQLARYYNIPSRGSAGATDSKVLDMCAGYETALNLILATMAGINYIHYCTGGMDLTLTASYEKTVIDHEVLSEIYRIFRGIEVSEDSLALDAIRKVGPGGHFLSSKHTLTHLKIEQPTTILADRDRYETWVKKGKMDIKTRAKARVLEILREHEVEQLDKDVKAQLEKYVKDVVKRK
ncbi:MAG: trimethylamine methyltransferase family protein [Candidatus Methanomethylicia archaeon]